MKLIKGKFNMLNSLLLFIHILLNLHLSRKMGQNRAFTAILSPMVWNFVLIGQIIFWFLIVRLDISSILFKILLLYIPNILIFYTQWVLINRWREHIVRQFEFFLNNLIAQIKMGYGFRSGFKTAAAYCRPAFVKNYFMEILEFLTLNTQLRPELLFSPLREIIQELKGADRSHKCLEHLENLRQHLQIRSRFRQKVQTALLQVHAQSVVLVILYSGLLVFILSRHGMKYPKILFGSLFCFILGLIFLFRSGRKIKWTI